MKTTANTKPRLLVLVHVFQMLYLSAHIFYIYDLFSPLKTSTTTKQPTNEPVPSRPCCAAFQALPKDATQHTAASPVACSNEVRREVGCGNCHLYIYIYNQWINGTLPSLILSQSVGIVRSWLTSIYLGRGLVLAPWMSPEKSSHQVEQDLMKKIAGETDDMLGFQVSGEIHRGNATDGQSWLANNYYWDAIEWPVIIFEMVVTTPLSQWQLFRKIMIDSHSWNILRQ